MTKANGETTRKGPKVQKSSLGQTEHIPLMDRREVEKFDRQLSSPAQDDLFVKIFGAYLSNMRRLAENCYIYHQWRVSRDLARETWNINADRTR
jgi:hypothetical protein